MTENFENSIRLDQILVSRGLFPSRSRARDAIQRGTVTVDGVTVTKAGATFGPDVAISTTDAAQVYVSRAALKLIAGLDHFGFDPAGLDCLDIGASTGGFSQVLLERGAAHVTAVDVGHEQLHPLLKDDPRLTNYEGLNSRVLDEEHIDGRTIMGVVSDVSFISLKLALPPALELASPGAFLVALVKPQFEAGKDGVGKKGMLKDPEVQGPALADDLSAWLGEQEGWTSLGHIPCPLAGGDGTREYLLGGRKA
jgi:23S rRNA (cytidine1920-2'-O)/16S rRNA (cytidine1409-2'-O)-methyltransferase